MLNIKLFFLRRVLRRLFSYFVRKVLYIFKLILLCRGDTMIPMTTKMVGGCDSCLYCLACAACTITHAIAFVLASGTSSVIVGAR